MSVKFVTNVKRVVRMDLLLAFRYLHDQNRKNYFRSTCLQVLKNYLEKQNLTVQGSITWLSHQMCDDMFIYSKWNGTTTYGFGGNPRDFGTDYGICCWYTPGSQIGPISAKALATLNLMFATVSVAISKTIGRTSV